MKVGTPEGVHPAGNTGAARTGEAANKPAHVAPHKGEGHAAGQTPDASAQVKISSTATGLLDKSTSNADFDSDKVARISQAISNGTYKVDAGAIADKLIANAHELLGKVSK